MLCMQVSLKMYQNLIWKEVCAGTIILDANKRQFLHFVLSYYVHLTCLFAVCCTAILLNVPSDTHTLCVYQLGNVFLITYLLSSAKTWLCAVTTSVQVCSFERKAGKWPAKLMAAADREKTKSIRRVGSCYVEGAFITHRPVFHPWGLSMWVIKWSKTYCVADCNLGLFDRRWS